MALATHAAGHMSPEKSLTIKRAGLWLFFFSESILFGLLLSGRFFLEGIEAEHVDQNLGLIITIVLLVSSVSAYTAETAIEHNRHGIATIGLLITILLGVLFAGGVAFEWAEAEFSRQDTFGTAFFAMTGVHAAHVVSGVVMLILVFAQHLRGKYNSKDHWPVSGTVMYWHFVDVVWVFFYPALYLVQGVGFETVAH